MKVAVIGGTGDFGLALALRLVGAGDEVVIGSRDANRAQERASEVGASGSENAEAVRGADLVVLATRADAALVTAAGLADAIGRTPLLSVASELSVGPAGAQPGSDPRSLAERTQELVRAPVAAGLHSLAAGKLARDRPDEDAFVCGDDPEAKRLALELAAKVVAGRALDAGPLVCARALEGLTAVLVNLNRRYEGHAGLHVTGLP
jgi:8-hydroxy-5-deazaflavin:NADPH oxidoreductase